MSYRPGKRSIEAADKANREKWRKKKRESRAKQARDAKNIPPEMYACTTCGFRSPTAVHQRCAA